MFLRGCDFIGVNKLDMKQSNALTVLWALRSCKTSTIKDLAQITGLSFATVCNILNGFVESGEVILGNMQSTTGGRPSQAYTFHAEYAYVLALSTRIRNGKNIISASVGNLYGEIVWQEEQNFDTIQLTSFESIIESSLQAYPSICIVAFSLPGIERNGVILINDYTELVGISFTKHFQSKYQLSVVIENDVNTAVFGYARKIEAVSVLVGIYFPRAFGPGAGTVIDKIILKGSCGFAGEVCLLPIGIDWLTIDYENPKEVGPAISRLISIFCGTVNPDQVVLYGDFFNDALIDVIKQEIPNQAIGNIFPDIDYTSDLDNDIIAGLFALALSEYQYGVRGKDHQWIK